MALGEVADARADVEALSAAIALAQQRLAHDQRVEGRDEGAHRQPVDRRRGDQRQLAHAGERQLQRARDRRRGERQHVHVGFQLLQPLLVLDAEMLLLVDDQQAEVAELDALAEQRVGADDDIDAAVGDAGLHLPPVRLAPTRREAWATRTGRPEKRSLKVRKCWRASSVVGTTTATWRPARAAMKAARSATSVLPKPTSPQISRSIGVPVDEIVDHRVDRRLLVLGLLVGEARGELVVEPSGGVSAGAWRVARAAATLISASAMSRMRFFIRALRACQATPPSLSSCDVGLLRAVARQQLDVLDRQVDAVVAGIDDFEAVVRGAGRLDGLEADEAADAVVDVDDEIAFGERGDVGEEVGRRGAWHAGAPGGRRGCPARR